MNAQKTELNRILEITGKIVKISADDDYIYRGEQECYEKVSSTLYRQLVDLDLVDSEIEKVQKKELEEAKKYINETNELKILIEIQHFGGKTNLIDFTEDYCVALFFAVNGSPDKDGRIILQNKNGPIKDWVREISDRKLESRSRLQESIFVEPPNGFIQPDEIIVIPQDLKRPIAQYIEKEFSISSEYIYHDIQGFVSSQVNRWRAYSEISEGEKSQNTGQKTVCPDEKIKHYQKAAEHFSHAINSLSSSAEIYYNRGHVYHQLGEFDLAIQDYSMAIKLYPNLTEAYDNRGLAYDEKGEFDFAIQDYNTAIGLNPNRVKTFINRGRTYSGKENYDRAIEDCSKAIQMNSDNAEAYNNRGFVYSSKEMYEQAIADYNKAIELEPNYVNAYYNRGLTYSRKGNIDLAIKDYDKVIELDPNNANVYNSRGVAYSQKSEFSIAIKNYNKAIELDSDNASVYYNRGRNYQIQGEENLAIEDYEMATKLKPDHAYAYANRAVIYLHKGEIDTAITDCDTAIALLTKPEAINA